MRHPRGIGGQELLSSSDNSCQVAITGFPHGMGNSNNRDRCRLLRLTFPNSFVFWLIPLPLTSVRVANAGSFVSAKLRLIPLTSVRANFVTLFHPPVPIGNGNRERNELRPDDGRHEASSGSVYRWEFTDMSSHMR